VVETQVWTFLGQAVVVIVGWWIVHLLSEKRDWEKARREMTAKSADAMIDMTTTLHADSRAYHLADRNDSLEVRIIGSLQDFGARTNALGEICSDASSLALCATEIIRLRQAITLEHFADEHTAALHSGDKQLEAIAEAIVRVKRAFLRLKHRQFKKS
jgi:hypothetical protein